MELLITMTIGLIMLTALSSTFLMQRKVYDVQEQIVEMVQNVRAAMDMMTREIRMAGYDPTNLAGAGIVNATSNSINFTLDITDDTDTGTPDEDTDDSNENITYSLYTEDSIQKLGRKSKVTANNQPVAENIDTLEFTYTLKNGTVIAPPTNPTIAQILNIVKVDIKITAKTTKPDSDYTHPTDGDHYRRYTLTSVITPRNLNL
ncbi:MAG: hypothetical protein HF982_14775 [Desulfobacteraceae bacterium]|nr:hypothetical protein [Desulfobacteraceae bacterium]MBC2720821.1 hypothetical protein [Desulfobacteraceae bacterium]